MNLPPKRYSDYTAAIGMDVLPAMAPKNEKYLTTLAQESKIRVAG